MNVEIKKVKLSEIKLNKDNPRRISDADMETAWSKPVELFSKFVRLYAKGGFVIDPFLGSGTTMVACHNLNRKCRGIEISENYCAVILQRMTDAFPGIEIKKITK